MKTPRYFVPIVSNLSFILLFGLACLWSASAFAQSISLPVRGNMTVSLKVSANTKQLTLLKRDLNIYAGADVLSYELRTSAGSLVKKGQLADDGIITKGGGKGKLQKLILPISAGTYRLVLTNSGSDCIFDVQASDALIFWNKGSLTLNDPSKKGSLYFYAPKQKGSLTIGTWHTPGTQQDIELWQGTKRLSKQRILAVKKDLTFVIPGGSDILELRIPKMNVYLRSSHITGYASSKTRMLPSSLLNAVIRPQQPRAVASGGQSALQFRILNTATTANTATIQLPKAQKGCSLRFATGQSSQLSFKAKEQKTLSLVLSCDSSTTGASRVPLVISARFKNYPTSPVEMTVEAYRAKSAKPTKQRPVLFWTMKEVKLARERVNVKKLPWAVKIFQTLKRNADNALGDKLFVTEGEGAWAGYYVCKEGPRLRFDLNSPTKHYCSASKTYYQGDVYDAVWRTYRYNRLSSTAADLGIMYLFTNERKYAQKVIDILLLFTRRYLSYQLHDNVNRYGPTASRSAGRLMAQTLSEASWMIGVLSAYDSVVDSGVMTESQKVDIEHNLLRPAIATIFRYDAGKSNWQAWHNAAIGAAGYTLGESSWSQFALQGKHGFQYHMKVSMLPDGFWYEGSISYHLYTLSAYQWLALAAYHAGVDLYKQGVLKMVKAPLTLAFPDLQFPKLNDSGSGGLSSMNRYFELAAGINGDKAVIDTLQALQSIYKYPRTLKEALFYGPDLKTGKPVSLGHFNFTSLGFAILRGGAGLTGMYAGLDYGPHGGWHGHHDKLQLLLHAGGQLLLPDMGTTAYKLPFHAGYFKQTIAHNTIMIGEKNQLTGLETPRKLTYMRDIALPNGPSLAMMQGVVGKDVFGANRSVARSLLQISHEYLVDAVRVDNASTESVDLLFHGKGRLLIQGSALRAATQAAARWKKSTQGHKYLTPPTLFQGNAATILEGDLPTKGPSHFAWVTEIGIGHDMETTKGWSKGSLSTDRQEGKYSLLWAFNNDGKVNFLNRSYTHAKLEISDYDTLEFYAKFNTADCKWFGVKIYDLPRHNQSAWRLDDKIKIQPGKWVKYTINLQKPDATYGGAGQAEIITFRAQGSGKGTKSLQILLDNMSLKKKGKPEKRLQSGLSVETWRDHGGPSKWLAANGLNNPPTSTHPMLFLRAASGHVRYLSVLRPYQGSVPSARSSRTSATQLKVTTASKMRDTVDFDAKQGEASWIRLDDKGAVKAVGYILKSGVESAGRILLKSQKGSLLMEVTAPGVFRYHAKGTGKSELWWPWKQGQGYQILLDKKPIQSARIATSKGITWLVVTGLPEGTHGLELQKQGMPNGESAKEAIPVERLPEQPPAEVMPSEPVVDGGSQPESSPERQVEASEVVTDRSEQANPPEGTTGTEPVQPEIPGKNEALRQDSTSSPEKTSTEAPGEGIFNKDFQAPTGCSCNSAERTPTDGLFALFVLILIFRTWRR